MANLSALPAGKYEPMPNALLSFADQVFGQVCKDTDHFCLTLLLIQNATGRRAQAHLVQRVSVSEIRFI